jgi:hypothetical protein
MITSGLSIRVLEAPPVGVGQPRQQAHAEFRQRRCFQDMGVAIGGMPMRRPTFPTAAALDLEAGGTVVTDEAQPADEQHRREAVPLRTDDGELARDLRLEVVRIVSQCHHMDLYSHKKRCSLWQDRKSGGPQVSTIIACNRPKKIY